MPRASRPASRRGTPPRASGGHPLDVGRGFGTSARDPSITAKRTSGYRRATAAIEEIGLEAPDRHSLVALAGEERERVGEVLPEGRRHHPRTNGAAAQRVPDLLAQAEGVLAKQPPGSSTTAISRSAGRRGDAHLRGEPERHQQEPDSHQAETHPRGVHVTKVTACAAEVNLPQRRPSEVASSRAVIRRALAWTLVTPLAAAGIIVAHAAADSLTGTPTGPVHAYLDHVPQIVAVLATIGLVGLAVQQRRVGSRSIWAFALAAPVGFACQEHVERLIHTGEIPWLLTTPSFLVGLALQVPVPSVHPRRPPRRRDARVGPPAAAPPALGVFALPLSEARGPPSPHGPPDPRRRAARLPRSSRPEPSPGPPRPAAVPRSVT